MKGKNMRRYINFFCREQFSDRLFLLNEGYSMVHRFTIGLVIGDEKIMVIDAGLGMTNDLRSYIEQIVGTDRPIICVCTHGHRDNVGSACQFDEAYCSHKDLESGESPFDSIQRYCDLVDYSLESSIVMDYCRRHMIMNNRCEMKDLNDGDIFDLGGVKIEAIAVPGHSAGSFAFYNAEEKYCFTGDAVNTDVHLQNLDPEGFRTYRASMERLLTRISPETVIYPAHLPLPMTTDIIRSLIHITDDIIAQNVEKDPPAESIFHGKNNNRNIRGHYYNNTCIIYDRNKIGLADVKPDYDAVCYYSHEKWTDRIYTVTINPSTVNRITLMVFIGDEKILLIDSGHGIDDRLRTYIESFAGSGKPMILALTHIGIDHGGAATLFDEVYLHQNDIGKIPRSLEKNNRLGDVQPFSNYNKEFEEYTLKHIIERIDENAVKEVNDGDVFHLGNLDVEAIFTPGHSQGHMAYYCAAEKIAFTGDAMNVDTHLKGPNDRQFFLNYAKMLQNFLDRVDPDTKIFSAHLNRPHSMRVPRNIQAACLELAAGQTFGDAPGEAIQKHTNGFHNPNTREHYHGLSCVVYNIKTLNSSPAD